MNILLVNTSCDVFVIIFLTLGHEWGTAIPETIQDPQEAYPGRDVCRRGSVAVGE